MKKQIHLLGGALVVIALLTINSTAFADFVIKSGATMVVKSTGHVTSKTNITIESGATLDNSGTVMMKGESFTNNGTVSLGSGEVIFGGTTSQFVLGNSSFGTMTVNNSDAGGVGLLFGGSQRVETALNLNDGIVVIGAFDLTLGASITSVAGSLNSMIVNEGSGLLKKEFNAPAGTPIVFDFPVGDRTGTWQYTPIELTVNDGDFVAGDYIGVGVTNAKQPNNHSTTHFLNRYWTIGVSMTDPLTLDYDAVADYDPAEDVTGTATSMWNALYVSPEWFIYNSVTPSSLDFTGLTTGGDLTGVEFQYLAGMKVFLQGAFDDVNDNMRADMKSVMPLSAAAAYPNYGYSGTESVAATEDIPDDAVDWILVQLRDATSAPTASSGSILQTVAGFVLQDGRIVSVDGESALPFVYTVANNPYFVIIHRNHIRVMSASNTLTKTNSTYIYDFTILGSAYGISPTVELKTGVYGLWAGETNTSNIISNSDKQAVDDNIDALYHIGDVNLSGIVSNEDKQFVDENIDVWGKVPK